MIRAEGCDLSRYDVSFSPEIATGPIEFAFQKATQGNQYVDLKYDSIWEGLQCIGVRGAYHYQVAGLSWIAQADHFLETAAKHNYHIYALDVEEYGNTYTDTFFADCKRVVDYWQKEVNKKVVIYTNGSTYEQMYLALGRLYGVTFAKHWMDGVGLWLASIAPTGAPFMPKYRNTPWQFHQYNWKGLPSRWGTGGTGVDENVFNGDVDALYKWAGFDHVEGGELPQEGETMAYQYEAVSAFRMSLRPAHDTNNAPITTIPAQSKMQGDAVWEDGVSEKWLEVKAVNGVTLAVSGWVEIEHEGRMYCTLTNNTPPVSTFPPEITLKIGTAEQVYVVKNVS